MSLRQIAAATKISITALEALERSDLSRLPGGIFSRAFVRAYAVEVGLDPETAVKSFLEEFERTQNQAAETEPPEVTADDREFLERQRQAARMLRGGVIALIVLAAAALVFWQFRSRAASPPPVSAPRVELPPPDAATPAPVVPAASAPAASETGPIALVVDVVSPCWLQLNSDGAADPIVSRVLNPGEHHEFRADREVVLQVGSAGAIKWSINGRAAKPLGKLGERVRVTISHANLKDFLQ
jgi:hypothetical protein